MLQEAKLERDWEDPFSYSSLVHGLVYVMALSREHHGKNVHGCESESESERVGTLKTRGGKTESKS